ncbi:MAG: tyrosine-type recombinase/integrase, partial [Planctomycetota bacterium]
MAKSNRNPRSCKSATDQPNDPRPRPGEPTADFGLSAHASGKWQKKIRGKTEYFGRWGRIRNGKMERLPGSSWWKPALVEYREQAEALHSGRTPRGKGDELIIKDLCNRFLTAKTQAVEAGEITALTFAGYRQTTDLIVAAFGSDRLVDDLASEDFESLRQAMAKRWGPVRLGNEIQKVRTVFKYGYEAGLIDKPVRYGPQFKKPSASVLRRHKAKSGEKMLEADEIRRLLDAAEVQMKAMLLLGVNAGFGNHDIAMLQLSALDLNGGWVDFPRPKTGITRRCPLWPATVAALRVALDARPAPKSEQAADNVFVTVRGRPWLSRGVANPVSVAARDLMKSVGVHRKGIGFYTLRHVFRTVADGTRDQVAVNHIMGHADASMASTYRER